MKKLLILLILMSLLSVVSVNAIDWTPEQLTTAFWIDASNTSTITNISGGKVTQVDDLSGNARHITQTIDANRPLTETQTINGLNVIEFIHNDTLKTQSPATWLNGVKFNFISVLKVNSETGQQGLYIGTNHTSPPVYASNTLHIGQISGTWLEGHFGSDASWSHALDTTPMIVANSFLNTGADAWINGTSLGATETNPTSTLGTNGHLSIGGKAFNSWDAFNGTVGEVVVTTGELNITNRQLIEGYLAHKWSLNASLPLSHPYRNESPQLPTPPTPPINYTALNHFDIIFPQIVTGSNSYVLLDNTTINRTQNSQMFMRGTLNAQKQTVGTEKDVYVKFVVNGVDVYDKQVATVSTIGSVKSSKIMFENLINFTTGSNTIETYVRQDSIGGTTNISNFELHVLEDKTSSNGNITIDILHKDFNFVNTAYANVQNFTMTKGINSSTLIDIDHKFYASATTTPTCYLENGAITSQYSRYLSSGTDTGSSGVSLFNNVTDTAGSINWLMSCKQTNAETVSNNVTFSSIDMSDNLGNMINGVTLQNKSINITNPKTFTAGTNLIQSYSNFTVQSGNYLEFIMKQIYQSQSDLQTPNMYVTIDNGTITSTDLSPRTLTTNDEVGTNNHYHSLPVNVGDSYAINFYVVVETGETLNLTDYTLSVIEASQIDITSISTPPIISLQSPTDNEILTNTTVFFNYIVDDVSNCTLYLNSLLNQTQNQVSGSNTMNTTVPDNSSNNWFISCINNFAQTTNSTVFNFNVSVPVTPPTPPNDLNSPITEFSSTQQALFWIFVTMLWFGAMILTFTLKGPNGNTIQIINVFQTFMGIYVGLGWIREFSVMIGLLIIMTACGVFYGLAVRDN